MPLLSGDMQYDWVSQLHGQCLGQEDWRSFQFMGNFLTSSSQVQVSIFLPLNLLLTQSPNLGTWSPGPSRTQEKMEGLWGNGQEQEQERTGRICSLKADSEVGYSGGILHHEILLPL